jgi:hypothetical protein
MQKIKLILVIAVLLQFSTVAQPVQSQVLRIVTINTLNGAITGTALGGATIALNNEYDPYPLRFGLGLGTIFGLGTGFYDMSHYTGYGYQVRGLFSSANTTGTIILLDTFYGAATGAIVGMAITLMGKDSDVIKGLQYGSGAGAWVGFAFGLVDAFALSTSRSYDSFYDDYSHAGHPPAGLVELRSNNDQFAIGFLNPVLLQSLKNHGEGAFSTRTHFGLELTRFQVAF